MDGNFLKGLVIMMLAFTLACFSMLCVYMKNLDAAFGFGLLCAGVTFLAAIAFKIIEF